MENDHILFLTYDHESLPNSLSLIFILFENIDPRLSASQVSVLTKTLFWLRYSFQSVNTIDYKGSKSEEILCLFMWISKMITVWGLLTKKDYMKYVNNCGRSYK